MLNLDQLLWIMLSTFTHYTQPKAFTFADLLRLNGTVPKDYVFSEELKPSLLHLLFLRLVFSSTPPTPIGFVKNIKIVLVAKNNNTLL
jgi:hypothetical protein